MHGKRFLLHSARPEPFYEESPTVGTFDRVVTALYANHVAAFNMWESPT
jgi:hypothetical protein